jgi:hypothetical protein
MQVFEGLLYIFALTALLGCVLCLIEQVGLAVERWLSRRMSR